MPVGFSYGHAGSSGKAEVTSYPDIGVLQALEVSDFQDTFHGQRIVSVGGHVIGKGLFRRCRCMHATRLPPVAAD
jgi:hypothetical protein